MTANGWINWNVFDALIKLEYYFTNLYVQLSRFVNNKLIKKQKSFIYEILHRWIILRTQIIKFFVKLHRFKTVVARIPFLKSILKLMLVCRPGKFLVPLNCSMRNVREKYHIYEIAPTHNNISNITWQKENRLFGEIGDCAHSFPLQSLSFLHPSEY